MPNTYTLVVKIDQKSVAQFNEQGWLLNFASGVSVNGQEIYDVVAYTSHSAANVTIAWQDEYAIAATDSTFTHGALFGASTDTTSISFGQSYTLPKNWTNGTVQTDSKAPPQGFNFVNQTNAAAAVLYKKIQGRQVPIYISPDAPLPQGIESFNPIEKVRVWFSNTTQSSTMVSEFASATFDVDFTGTTKQTVSFSQGTWTAGP